MYQAPPPAPKQRLALRPTLLLWFVFVFAGAQLVSSIMQPEWLALWCALTLYTCSMLLFFWLMRRHAQAEAGIVPPVLALPQRLLPFGVLALFVAGSGLLLYWLRAAEALLPSLRLPLFVLVFGIIYVFHRQDRPR